MEIVTEFKKAIRKDKIKQEDIGLKLGISRVQVATSLNAEGITLKQFLRFVEAAGYTLKLEKE